MKKKFLSGVFCLLLIGVASCGWCDDQLHARFVSPMIGGHLFEGNQGLDNGPTFGLGIGSEYCRQYGWEAVFNYSNSETDPGGTDVDVVTYRLDGFYNLLTDNKLVPYVAAGLGGMYFKFDGSSADRFMVDYGAGVKYFINDSLALRGDVRHLISFNDSYNNLLYTAGLTWFFDKGRSVKTETKTEMVATPVEAPAPVVSDSDGDGVADAADECPGTPAGVAVDSRGCPPDTDNDGVYDYLDQCPNTPAGADVDENGCWVIKAPLFATDKWEIKPDYYATLDEVARVIKNNPGLKLEIGGYADIRGTAEYNQKLSEKRAKAVEAYFVSKGIDPERMHAVGYGFTHPVASNDTPEGMTKNRRVEVKTIKIVIVQ